MSRTFVAIALVLLGYIATARAGDTKPDDAFQPGSVWSGTISGDDRKPRTARDRAAMLRVVERDGQNFTAELLIGAKRGIALRLEGKVVSRQIAARVTKIIRGAWPDGTVDDAWTGAVKGEQLVLQHTNKQNLTSTAELALEKPGASGGARSDD